MTSKTYHQFRFSKASSLATCRCRRWFLTDLKKSLTEESAKRNYELHKEMTSGHVRQDKAA